MGPEGARRRRRPLNGAGIGGRTVAGDPVDPNRETAISDVVTGPANPVALPVTSAITLLMTSALSPFLAGALAVQIQAELGFGDRGLGIAVAGFFTVAGLTGPLGGRIADRLGWRGGTFIGSAMGVAALLTMALGVHSLQAFVATLTAAGLVHGLTGPTSNLTLTTELPPARLGLGFGVKQAAIPLVTMVAGLSVPVVALTVGWRWAFAGAVAAPLTAAITAGLARAAADRGGRPERAAPRPRTPLPRGALGPLSALALAGGLATIAVGSLGTFTVRTAVEAGLTEGTAGVLVALASLAGLTTRVVSGWVADRRSSSGFVPAAGLMAAGATGFLLMATGRPALVVPGVLLGYGAGWGWAGLYILGVVNLHPRAPGAATGITQIGTAGGAAVGPFVFGLIVAHLGFAAAWTGTAGVTLVAVYLLVRGAAWIRRRAAIRVEPGTGDAATQPLPP